MSNLLEIHNTFKLPSNLLARTHYSAMCSKINSAEFDESYQIITSLLSDRIYQIYVKHNEEDEHILENLKLVSAESYLNDQSKEVTLSDVWDGLLESIPIYIKKMIGMARDMPGINELSSKDFTFIINNRLFDYYLLRQSPFYINGEYYNILPNKVKYTRYWMNKIIGKEMVDALFEWTEELNKMDLTKREKALLYPYLLTAPGL
jgi:hypothetical protein